MDAGDDGSAVYSHNCIAMFDVVWGQSDALLLGNCVVHIIIIIYISLRVAT